MTKTNKILSYIFITLLLVVAATVGKNSMTSEGKMDSDQITKNSAVNVFLDDKIIAFSNKPVIKDDKVYVSVDEFTEKLDVDADFSKSNKIVIKKEDKSLVINTQDCTAITENDESFFLTSINKGKKVLLPIDIIANHFGFNVSNLTENTVKVYSSSNKLENIEGEVVTEKEVKEVKEVKEDETKKVAYLTFDDGPNVNTPEILDVLKEKNVKATFFMLGSSILSHEDITKRVYDEGHAVGVHSMTHNKKLVYAHSYAFLNEMNKTNDLLLKITGSKTMLLRAPYGSKPYMSQEIRDLTSSWGYRLWDWNVDSRDSLKSNTTSEEVYKAVVDQVANKNEAVILFHDKAHTAESLPKIIDYLVANGFEIKKLDRKIAPMNFWNDVR